MTQLWMRCILIIYLIKFFSKIRNFPLTTFLKKRLTSTYYFKLVWNFLAFSYIRIKLVHIFYIYSSRFSTLCRKIMPRVLKSWFACFFTWFAWIRLCFIFAKFLLYLMIFQNREKMKKKSCSTCLKTYFRLFPGTRKSNIWYPLRH